MTRQDLFDDLIPFVEVARQESFTEAARQLGLTPAAVSKAIKRLEARLGIVLLHRTTRQVRLSREGAIFLERCEAAITQVRAGRELMAVARERARGDLTVTTSLILGRALVTRLPTFTRRYPGVRLHLRLSDRFVDMIEEGVDVAVRIGPLEDSSRIARRLATTRWITLASPEYLARRGVPDRPQKLRDHECLKFRAPNGRLVEWTFQGRGQEDPSAHPTPTTLDLDHGELLLEAARVGLGICQALGYMAAELVEAGQLTPILEPWAAPGPPIHAVCLPGRQHTPRVRAFLDLLAEEFP